MTPLAELRQRIHEGRVRHDSFMASAESKIVRGHGLRDTGLPVEGFGWIQSAIADLVECGCPWRIWPEVIRDAIPDPGEL